MNKNSQILKSTFGDQGWYINQEEPLKKYLKTLFSNQQSKQYQPVMALIAPHAGYRFCGSVFAKAMQKTMQHRYQRIVIIGPSHYIHCDNKAVLCDYQGIQTILGTQLIDQDAIHYLKKEAYFITENRVHEPEHSIQLHLPFIQYCHENTPIVPMIIGDLDNKAMRAITKAIKPLLDKNTLLMISSDFTHYGAAFAYEPFKGQQNISQKIKALDTCAINHILNKDLAAYQHYIKQEQPSICGRVAIELLLRLSLDQQYIPSDCAYATSAQLTGDETHSVSYASLIFKGVWQ